jgi:hypothetical protein
MGGCAVAVADDSGHLSMNTLKTQQYAQHHHMSASAAAMRDPIPNHTYRNARHYRQNYRGPYGYAAPHV